MTKKKADKLIPGDMVRRGKKTLQVRSVSVIELPVERTVRTAVVTFAEVGDDGDPIFHDVHIRADKALDVVVSKVESFFSSLFGKKKPVFNEETLVSGVSPKVKVKQPA